MTIDDFLMQFANAIELPREQLSPDTAYQSLENWDSLCVLNTIAMVDAEYGVTLSGRDIERASTVRELFDVACSKATV
jgi:acyl carrier protein